MENAKSTITSMGLIILLYSILVFAGGLTGYILKNSLSSLLMGGLFALSLVFTSVHTLAFRKWGLYVSFGLILLLDAFFSYRFVITQVFFPAGLMLFISTLTLIILILKLRKLNHASKNPTN